MANGEVSLTNNAKRVLCLVYFSLWVLSITGSKPSCLWFNLIVGGFKVKLRIFADPLNTCFYHNKLQLDYWTELGLVPFLVL